MEILLSSTAIFSFYVMKIKGILGGLLPGGLGERANQVSGTDGKTRQQMVVGLVRNGLILLFVAMIILAILYAITSGIKFMRAQGDSGEIEEATESIKYVVIGVGFAFVGIILVILIGTIFAPDSDAEAALTCFLGDFDTCTTGNNGDDS